MPFLLIHSKLSTAYDRKDNTAFVGSLAHSHRHETSETNNKIKKTGSLSKSSSHAIPT